MIDHKYNLYFSRIREINLVDHDPLRNIEDLFENIEFNTEETNNINLDKINFSKKDNLKHMKFYNFFNKSRDIIYDLADDRNHLANEDQYQPE